jgi:hypothetical protein
MRGTGGVRTADDSTLTAHRWAFPAAIPGWTSTRRAMHVFDEFGPLGGRGARTAGARALGRRPAPRVCPAMLLDCMAGSTPDGGVEGRRAEVTRQRWADVHALRDKGIATTAISQALNLDPRPSGGTRAATANDLLTDMPRRGSQFDAHTAYLAQHWQEGCTNAARLTTELREHGYRGSVRSVRRLLRSWRADATPPTAIPDHAQAPGCHRVDHPAEHRPLRARAGRPRAHPRPLRGAAHRRPARQRLRWDAAPAPRSAPGHLDRKGAGQRRVSAQGIRHRPAQGLRRRRNGLTLDWSSGTVEGLICRLKAVKRAMFGRASFDLLRRRVLLAT